MPGMGVVLIVVAERKELALCSLWDVPCVILPLDVDIDSTVLVSSVVDTLNLPLSLDILDTGLCTEGGLEGALEDSWCGLQVDLSLLELPCSGLELARSLFPCPFLRVVCPLTCDLSPSPSCSISFWRSITEIGRLSGSLKTIKGKG